MRVHRLIFARRNGGVELAGWSVDREIRLRFPAATSFNIETGLLLRLCITEISLNVTCNLIKPNQNQSLLKIRFICSFFKACLGSKPMIKSMQKWDFSCDVYTILVSDLISNTDHMHISDNEPSSVIFSQKKILVKDFQFFNFLNYFVWLRITDEGSVPEMRIWSILLIKCDLKWSKHLSRSLFVNLYNAKVMKNKLQFKGIV